MPVREIKKSYRSVTGTVPSEKMGRAIEFESTLERDFYLLQEFRANITAITEQPVRFTFEHNGECHEHTPDAIIEYDGTDHSGRRFELVDIKYRSEIRETWAELHPILRATARFARSRGWNYKIWTEVEIRCAELSNAKLLLPLRKIGDVGEASQLVPVALARVPLSIRSLCELVKCDDIAQAQRAILVLIAHRVLKVDSARPLTRDSFVHAQ